MGAFNTVHIRWRNSQTSEVLDINVQFKYGDTWQHDYRVGDVIKWGGNDIGHKNARRAVVDGCLDAPAASPGMPESFEVHILNGKIEKVIPATGSFDFAKAGDSFIILDRPN